MYTSPSEIGASLKKLREDQDLIQDDLAQRLGVHVNTVKSMESGERVKKWPNIAATAKALGVSPNQIFGWDDDAPAADEKPKRLADQVPADLMEETLFMVASTGFREQKDNPEIWRDLAVMMIDALDLTLDGVSRDGISLYLQGATRQYAQAR